MAAPPPMSGHGTIKFQKAARFHFANTLRVIPQSEELGKRRAALRLFSIRKLYRQRSHLRLRLPPMKSRTRLPLCPALRVHPAWGGPVRGCSGPKPKVGSENKAQGALATCQNGNYYFGHVPP
jgi:hypothetical protein